MRRQVALIITVFHLLGMVAVPVVAFSCVESGETAVVTYLSWSPRSCPPNSCCDDDQVPADAYPQSAISCCDLSIRTAPQNSRIILPGHKYGPAEPLRDTSTLFDTSLSDHRLASTRSALSVFHDSTNSPLLI